MKKFLFPVTAGLLFLASCKEKGPPIDFGTARSFDTTYTASTEAAEVHRVLIEEYTGVTCPSCPAGHQIISSLQTQYPGKVIAIGYHPYNQGQAMPLQGVSRYDFRNQKGTDLAIGLFGGIPFLPSGAIDRTKNGSDVLVSRSTWNATTDARLQVPSPVNLAVTSVYTADNRQAVIKVRTAFTSEVSKKLQLHIMLTESNIVDLQEYPNLKDTNYTHKHILRDIITPISGAAVIDSIPTKSPGRVFEKILIYTLSEAWSAENCKVIAFITNNEAGDIEVIQAAEGELD